MGNSPCTKNWIFLDRHGRKHLAQLTHCTITKQRIAFLDGRQLWNDRKQLHRGDEFSFDVDGTAGVIRMAKKRGKQSYTLRFGQSLVPHSEPTWVEYCLTHNGGLPDPVYEKELFPLAQPHGKSVHDTSGFFQDDDARSMKLHKTKRSAHTSKKDHQRSVQDQTVTQSGLTPQFEAEALSETKVFVNATSAHSLATAVHPQFETGPCFSSTEKMAELVLSQCSSFIEPAHSRSILGQLQLSQKQPDSAAPQSPPSPSQGRVSKKPNMVQDSPNLTISAKRQSESTNIIKKQKCDWEHVSTFLADDVFEFQDLPEEPEQFIPLPQLPLADDTFLLDRSPDICVDHTHDDIFMSLAREIRAAPC